jgi:hypothetical protein
MSRVLLNTKGLFGLWPQLTLPKKLVMPNIFPPVWLITNFLAAFGLLVVSFIDSSQKFGNLSAAESHAKKLANQFW